MPSITRFLAIQTPVSGPITSVRLQARKSDQGTCSLASSTTSRCEGFRPVSSSVYDEPGDQTTRRPDDLKMAHTHPEFHHKSLILLQLLPLKRNLGIPTIPTEAYFLKLRKWSSFARSFFDEKK